MIKKDNQAKTLGKLVRPFLESSDPKVRDKASVVMARLKDKFSAKI